MLSSNDVTLVGLGLHGSWVARAIAKLNPRSLLIWDGDQVEVHNLRSQNYAARHLGSVKSVATRANMLSAQRNVSVTAMNMWAGNMPALGAAHTGIVICCADSMAVRIELARQVGWLYGPSTLFIETRSLGNYGYVHAFNAEDDYVEHYIDTCFPETVAQVDCGGAGTIAMGMMMAALVTTIIAQWKGGGEAQLPLNEHCIQLGYGHQASPFILEERR